jgi:23S rRNA pseudoU1915 N3-methylase RlmH
MNVAEAKYLSDINDDNATYCTRVKENYCNLEYIQFEGCNSIHANHANDLNPKTDARSKEPESILNSENQVNNFPAVAEDASSTKTEQFSDITDANEHDINFAVCIGDNDVLPYGDNDRALGTLPNGLAVRAQAKQVGVFTKSFLPNGVTFGPYQGQFNNIANQETG